MPKICVFFGKKLQNRRASGAPLPNPYWPPAAGGSAPRPRFVFNTPYSSCFNIHYHLTPSRRWQSYHTFSKGLSKNGSIFLFEQVICSGVTRRRSSGGIHPRRRFRRCTNTLCSKIKSCF